MEEDTQCQPLASTCVDNYFPQIGLDVEINSNPSLNSCFVPAVNKLVQSFPWKQEGPRCAKTMSIVNDVSSVCFQI